MSNLKYALNKTDKGIFIRYLLDFIKKDLLKKMVFLGGPRQCGKTTLAKKILGLENSDAAYLNWDFKEDKRRILSLDWPVDEPLIIFDEIHKFPKWKSWVKGLYDKRAPLQKYLITGSARLDVYRKGGDSLLGRYHYWRLHPFGLDDRNRGIALKIAQEKK